MVVVYNLIPRPRFSLITSIARSSMRTIFLWYLIYLDTTAHVDLCGSLLYTSIGMFSKSQYAHTLDRLILMS